MGAERAKLLLAKARIRYEIPMVEGSSDLTDWDDFVKELREAGKL